MGKRKKSRVVGFNHMALEVGDIEEAPAFYAEFLDFELRSKSGHMTFTDLGDQFLTLSKSRRQAPDDDRRFGLVVENMAAVRRIPDKWSEFSSTTTLARAWLLRGNG